MTRSSNVLASLVRPKGASLTTLALLTAFASPGALTAQSVGDWRRVETRSAPPSRTGFTLVGDWADFMLMIGGDSSNPSATDWYWDGARWASVTLSGMPRRDGSGVCRLDDGSLLLYGGVRNGQVLAETWRLFGGTVWQQVAGGAVPGLLTDLSMAFDAATGRAVLVGRNGAGSYETWFWQAAGGWTAGAMFAAADARVVYDDVRGDLLLFRGGAPTIDVDVLDGTAWESRGATTQAATIGEVAFDARRGRAVVVQAFDSRDTVEWDGLAFGPVSAPTGAFLSPARTAATYLTARRELTLVVDDGAQMQVYRHAADSEAAGFQLPHACPAGADLSLGAVPPEPGLSHVLELPLLSGPVFLAAGLSRTQSAGVPLPLVLPGSTCTLEVAADVLFTMSGQAPAVQLVPLPNDATLLGARYHAQGLYIASNTLRSTNTLTVQVGRVAPEFELTESFNSPTYFDPLASGGAWTGGRAVGATLGGDGRHGSFTPSLGDEVAPGVFEISTDATTIPARNTLSGVAEQVTDGTFYFTDFVVPAGVTVRFVGGSSARVFVRGEVRVAGEVSVSAPAMPSIVQTSGPAAGQLVSTFNARVDAGSTVASGQPGGAGGPGGGRGGNGGDECLNQGPIVVNGVDVTSGQPGADVRVSAGHAYAGTAAGTGGVGSQLMPATGIWTFPTPLISNIYSGYFSAGGGGGGFVAPGGAAAQPVHTNVNQTIAVGPLTAGGSAFTLLPAPITSPGYSALDHFAVGGSGGGGGGSHGYGLLGIGAALEKWMAGHGGSGGGGVLALRAGGVIDVDGTLSSRGGDGALISGDDPFNTSTNDLFGISSPGGGGSGGSILLQSPIGVGLGTNGVIDCGGGLGARVGGINNTLQRMNGAGGDGATGFFRVESPANSVFGQTTPAYVPQQNGGLLVDSDAQSGSRSRWRVVPSARLPVYQRYELLATIDGVPVLFSDDPSVSPLAADDPNLGVVVRFQGAQLDAGGLVAPGTEGPWRASVRPGAGTLNADRAQAVRFDLVFDRTAVTAEVLELRIVWR